MTLVVICGRGRLWLSNFTFPRSCQSVQVNKLWYYMSLGHKMIRDARISHRPQNEYWCRNYTENTFTYVSWTSIHLRKYLEWLYVNEMTSMCVIRIWNMSLNDLLGRMYYFMWKRKNWDPPIRWLLDAMERTLVVPCMFQISLCGS
jgi:hypothetical protein